MRFAPHIIAFVLLLFGWQGSMKGQSEIDSMIAALSNTTDPLEYTVTCNRIASNLMSKDADQALLYANKARTSATEINDREEHALSLNHMGHAYEKLSKFDSAQFYYESSRDLAYSIPDTLIALAAINNLALAFWSQGKYDKAMDQALLAIKGYEARGNLSDAASGYDNIALILMEMQQPIKAKGYLLKSLHIYTALKNDQYIADAQLNMSIACERAMEYDSVGFWIDKCLPIFERLDDLWGVAIAHNCIGLVHKEKGEYDAALEHLQKSYDVYLELKSPFRLASSLYNQARVYQAQGNYEGMKKALVKAKPYIDEAQNLKLQKQIYHHLGLVHYKLGKKSTAADYYHTYATFVDSLYLKERELTIAEMEVAFQTEKKDKEIAEQSLLISNQEKDLAIAAQNKAEGELLLSNRNKWIFGLVGAFGILSLFLLYFRQRNAKKIEEERNALLMEEKEKRLTAVLQTQENERKRIAEDLHDGIVQQLGGLKLGLQKEFQDTENGNTTKLIGVLDQATSELRELSHNMMPRSLTALGLTPALQDMLENSLAHSKIKYTFEHFGSDQRFDPKTEVTVFRIVQELIQNVIKHSQASEVNVQLLGTDKSIVLIVEDNGVGFDIDKEQHGIGLLNISSRLNAIGGRVSFEQSPENGTLATVKIPLHQ